MRLLRMATRGKKKPLPESISWKLFTILYDGIDVENKMRLPLDEAIGFIRQYSKFKINNTYVASSGTHGYTYYDCNEGAKTCVVVNKPDIPQADWDAAPVADSYLLLWNAGSNPPLQAGSTWGVSTGVSKGGLNRPYASVPVDPWWYTTTPGAGFQYGSAARILAHELINCINCKLEVAPYNLPPLTADSGLVDYDWEKSRLLKLTDTHYRTYLSLNSEYPLI